MHDKIVELIKKSNHIVIASHINPDADTLGSMIGLAEAIRGISKKITLYNHTKNLPKRFDFLSGFRRIKDSLPKHFDLLISVDCASFDRIGIEKGDFKIINFDHHKTNTLFGDINVINGDYASCSMVVFEFLESVGLKINDRSATALYAALAEDSGFFKYERVDKRCFKIAEKLVSYGAEPNKIAELLTQRESLAKYRLMQIYLNNLELKHSGRVCISKLMSEDFEKCGAVFSDSDSFVQMGLSLATVELSIFAYELDGEKIKFSLRSKGVTDCSEIALSYAGGGHKRAAGFTANIKDTDDIIADILKRWTDEKR